MKVSVLCSGSYVSGLEVMALSVIGGLVERGHSVQVVVNGWTDGDFPSRLDAIGVPHTVAYLGKLSLRPEYVGWTIDALRHLPGGRGAFRKHVRTFCPDAVLAYNTDTLALVGDLLRALPVVHHVHEVPGVGRAQALALPLVRRAVTICIAVSEHVERALKGLRFADVATVYNGLDVPKRPLGAAALPEPGSRPLHTGIVGQVGKWKGHEDYVDALGILGGRGYSVVGHVFGRGEGAFARSLRARAGRLGVALEWHGFVPDQDDIYPHIDVLVAPSRIEEAFGLVAAEAGLHGLPAVVSARGGLQEIVIDGDSGLVVEAERPESLANALAVLAADPELRSRMGRAGRARAARLFSREKMVGGVEAVLVHAQAKTK